MTFSVIMMMICPVGQEEEFNLVLAECWRPYLETADVTPVGNFVGRVGGTGSRLLILAHSDEIGFAVRSIDERGFIRIASGQRDPVSRPFQRGPYFLPLGHPALILGSGEPMEGVFATATGHVLSWQQQEQFRLEWKGVFIDIGATSKEEVEALGIHVGSRIIWNPPTRRRGKFIYSKAMDNRGALAIMETFLREVNREELQCELWFGSSIQEEVGLVGAGSINRGVQANYAIALDVGQVGDIPTVDPLDVPTRLGGGPIIVQKDLGSYTRGITCVIEAAAERARIPFQRAAYNLFSTDASELVRQGVAAGVIAFPTRYTHSPFEMVHEDDMRACVDLLKAVTRSSYWSTQRSRGLPL